MNGKRSISSRFSLALTGIVAALLMLFATIVIVINMQRAEDRLADRLSAYLKLTRVSLSVPVWNLDYETAQGVIESLLLDVEVAYAEIDITSDTQILRVTHDESEMPYEHYASSSRFRTGKTDISNNGESIGTLRLAMSRQLARQQTTVEVIGIILLTTLVIGAIATTSILISRRYIAKPLARLKESASAIAQGDLDVTIDVTRGDEIGLLAQDFNAMRLSVKGLFDELQSSNKKLEQANSTLEERVAQRTTELSRTAQTFCEILEHCPAGLHIVDKDGILAYCNSAYRNLLGYSHSEIQHMSTREFWFNPEQHAQILSRLDAEGGQLLNQEVVFKTREGVPVAGLISYTQTLTEVEQINFARGSRVAWFYDVSKLKQAEEAKRESEQRLIDALESIGEGFAFFDESDELVLCNNRYRELLFEGAGIDFGAGSSFESILRKAVENGKIEDAKVDPETYIAKRLEQHRNPGAPVLQRRAGNRWLMFSERRVASGGTVTVFTDLTELKRREAEAEESQAKLQAILDYAPVLVFVKDLEGRYTLSNRAFNRFWGLTANEVIGMTDHDLFTEKQAKLFRQSDLKMLENGKAVVFEDTQVLDDKRRSSVINKFPLRDQNGEIYAICAITSDVTDLKEREEELKRTAERLELALSMEGVGIWDADLELNKVWWSRNYTELLGYDPDTFTPTSTTWEEILHSEVADEVIEKVNAFLDSNQSKFRRPLRIVRPDGTSIWMDSMMSVNRDHNGKALVLSGLDIDITEQLLRERKLAEANIQLETLSTKLSKYLSPQVYDSIFAGRQEVRLASKRKKLSIFFSDIVGFTELTDKMESEDLTLLINQYLTEMSDVALEHGATIDKYIGDAIMIFFGDPHTSGVKNDAISCVRMAIDMQERLQSLAADWRAAGMEAPLQCRIGINTDYCTVGNFGSNDRMDYTILGSGVNIASRLEQQAEAGGILISYETYAHVKDVVSCKVAGKVQVKGIAHPVSTYQVIGLKSRQQIEQTFFQTNLPHLKIDARPAQMTHIERTEAVQIFEEMLKRLRSGSEV